MKLRPAVLGEDDLKAFPFLRGAAAFDSSCSESARVFFIDKDGGYFLKKAEKGTLAREAAMDGYFRSLGAGPEVVAYASDTCDRLLTEKVRGEDCLAERYMSRPEKLCDLLAAILRDLHSVPTDGCPARHRTSEWLKTVALPGNSTAPSLGIFAKTESSTRYCFPEAADAGARKR